MGALVAAAPIEQRILLIRGLRIMLDADLAEVYGMSTKRLNEQVKRNRERFPEDFMFQLTADEKAEVVAKCDHLAKLKFSKALPFAFTEHGAVMLASVLNSPTAVASSILVVRAFIRLRELVAAHRDLAKRLEELERKYDAKFRVVFDSIRALMEPTPQPSPQPKRSIGFGTASGGKR
jgi:hypothetical protein